MSSANIGVEAGKALIVLISAVFGLKPVASFLYPRPEGRGLYKTQVLALAKTLRHVQVNTIKKSSRFFYAVIFVFFLPIKEA